MRRVFFFDTGGGPFYLHFASPLALILRDENTRVFNVATIFILLM